MRLLRPIRREERALSSETSTTASVRARIDELEQARWQIMGAIVVLSDIEDLASQGREPVPDVKRWPENRATSDARSVDNADEAMQDMTRVLREIKQIARHYGL